MGKLRLHLPYNASCLDGSSFFCDSMVELKHKDVTLGVDRLSAWLIVTSHIPHFYDDGNQCFSNPIPDKINKI